MKLIRNEESHGKESVTVIMKDGITSEILVKVLGKALGQDIKKVSFETEQLQGGTVGEIKLVYGVARTTGEKELPYKIVYKRQKKWERYGDPDSWRREYDLYETNLDTVFSNSFRWPKCYFAEISHIKSPYVKELILFKFGYRLVEGYKFAETSEERALQIETLHKIYEMENVLFDCI